MPGHLQLRESPLFHLSTPSRIAGTWKTIFQKKNSQIFRSSKKKSMQLYAPHIIKVWVSEKCSKKYSKKHSKKFYLLKKVNALF